MKRLLTILILTFSLTGCSAQRYFFHLIPRGVHAAVASNVKNIQSMDDSAYDGFQTIVQNKVNQATMYYSHATTHTTGGKLYYKTYNIRAKTWSAGTLFQTDSIHIGGCYGGKMDNDSTVLFSVRTHPNVQYGPRDIYIQKVDSNNNFSPAVAFDWTGITKLQGGFFFGPLIYGDTVGHYGMMLYQVNGDTGTTHYRISLIWTTDRWAHYYERGVVHDGTLDYSETAGVNLSGGKYLALSRKNNSGSLTPFESTNYGVTWTRKVASNLYWFLGGLPEIPYVYYHDGVFDIPFQCRDAAMIEISKNNTAASNFGNATPVYNDQEIFSHHIGTGGNPSLGYVSQLKLSNGYYLIAYSKEFNNNRANIQWTTTDLVTDPAGVPIAPTITASGITSTAFREDITGYSDLNWQSVRYLSMDLSTDVNFSTFVTAKYRSTSAFPAVSIHNIRVTGYFIPFTSLITGTTYYFRIKACNNAGCSPYTTTIVTTP